MEDVKRRLTVGTLLKFFIPLGISASLVNISHVIINSTLTRGEHPEAIVSTYAIAMSLFALTERLGLMLRQTSSALVRDRVSFRSVGKLGMVVIVCLLLFSTIVSWTSFGHWIFVRLFGVAPENAGAVVEVYRVLMFVVFFSSVRCLYQGVIIYNRQTKWLTIGMVIRLAGMYMLSWVFVRQGYIQPVTGAWIFLAGMAIECLISFAEGSSLVRRLPQAREHHHVRSVKHVLTFYRPLIFSSLMIVMVGPLINAFLGKTVDVQLAISSYALALSIVNLILSLFFYIHQLVLAFYEEHPAEIRRFAWMTGLFPALILGLLCFTDAGYWVAHDVMGASGRLLDACLDNLRVFLLMAILFPLIDFGNGLIMLAGQTKALMVTQSANVAVTLAVLIALTAAMPQWNGVIGALAHSMGMAGEAAMLFLFLKKGYGRPTRVPGAVQAKERNGP